MLTKQYNLELNLKQKDHQKTNIGVNQGDAQSVIFNIRVFDEATELDYGGITSAVVFFAKPDKTVVQENAASVGTGFVYTCSQNVLASPGMVLGGLALYGPSKERITTLYFTFWVERDLMDALAVASSSQFDALTGAVALLEQAQRMFDEFPELKVLGKFTTEADLLAAYPDGSHVGGGFFVGDSVQARYYYWSILTQKWENADPWKGETGEKGDPATVEVVSTATGEPGTQAVVTNTGAPSSAKLAFTIPRGETGQQGDRGPQGIQGRDGIQGPAGPSGGITAPVNGFYALYVNDAGDLMAAVPDDINDVPLRFDEASGNLYYEID